MGAASSPSGGTRCSCPNATLRLLVCGSAQPGTRMAMIVTRNVVAILAICAVLAAASAARACPMSVVPTLLVAPDVADTVTAARAMQNGAQEANPVLRSFASGPMLIGVTFTTDFLRHSAADRLGASCPQRITGGLLMIVLHGIMAIHNAHVAPAITAPNITRTVP